MAPQGAHRSQRPRRAAAVLLVLRVRQGLAGQPSLAAVPEAVGLEAAVRGMQAARAALGAAVAAAAAGLVLAAQAALAGAAKFWS